MVSGWLTGAGVAGMTAVALGAFGAHAVKSRVSPEMLKIFETGAHYHLAHAVALLGVAWVADRSPSAVATTAGFAFAVGIVLFSGSLYTMVLTGARWLGAVTPLGGVAFLVGWLCLIVAGLRTS